MFKNFFDGYEAVIFDLDGTIVHSESVWEDSLEEVFLPEIISVNPYLGERGQDIKSKIYTILKKNSFRSSISEDSYYELITNKFTKKIEEVEITPGFVDFARYLKNQGKKVVLVTNSYSIITNKIIEDLHLKEYFDFILTADDVNIPKPAPDIYKLALLKLNLSKDKVLVFEDSVNGANAAELAGLNMIIILPDNHKPSDYGSKNRLFIDNFEVINDELNRDVDTFIEDFFSR
jgi:HAD superfamily hydrolase (TIGR01509 family)